MERRTKCNRLCDHKVLEHKACALVRDISGMSKKGIVHQVVPCVDPRAKNG